MAVPNRLVPRSNGLFTSTYDGYGGGSNSSDAAANTNSGANYGPAALGFSTPASRSAVASLAGSALGLGIPGAGSLVGLGQSFNAGSLSALTQNGINTLGGKAPSVSLGSLFGGAVGLGTPVSDFGLAAMAHGLDPDQAQAAWDNNVANYNSLATSVSPQVAAMFAGSIPGYGIAGVAGPAASGVDPSVSVAGTFGANVVGQGAMGQDGTVGFGGTPGPGFGGLGTGDQATGTGNSEAGQGGCSMGGNSGGNDGGASGGGGANGGGGDNGGGYAKGGLVEPHHDFRRSSGFVHPLAHGRPEGVVHGRGGPTQDKVQTALQAGGFVLPADVVAKLGGGSPTKGSEAIAAALPKANAPAPGGKVFRGRLSPGEFYVHPAHVAAIGGGSRVAGAAKLAGLISETRRAA